MQTEKELEFSFDMAGVDRDALLIEAAQRLDRREGFLGTGDGPAKSESGKLARALLEDTAAFAAQPTVYPITKRDFLAAGRDVPVTFKELTRDARFYWVYFPIALLPQHNWGFNRLEVAVEFNPGDEPSRRPTAHEILPAKRFEEILSTNVGVSLRLDEQLEFAVDAPPIAVPVGPGGVVAGAGVNVTAAGGAGMVVGPLTYTARKARIDHTAVGAEFVRWRIDGAQFFQGTDAPLVVVLRVPNGTERLRITAAMQAYRYFAFASAPFQEAVKKLMPRLLTFFKAGAPLRDEADWTLTPSM